MPEKCEKERKNILRIIDEIMLILITRESEKFRGVYYSPLSAVRLLSGSSNPDICCYRHTERNDIDSKNPVSQLVHYNRNHIYNIDKMAQFDETDQSVDIIIIISNYHYNTNNKLCT